MNGLPNWTRRIAALLSLSLMALAGCAHRVPAPPAPPLHLLNDRLFDAPSVAVDRAQVFALSPAMRNYADTALRHGQHGAEL